TSWGLISFLSAQDAAKSAEASRRAQQQFAVGLLRSNSAELSYKMQHGSYVHWPVLLVNESQILDMAFSVAANGLVQSPPDHSLPEMHPTAGLEILPG